MRSLARRAGGTRANAQIADRRLGLARVRVFEHERLDHDQVVVLHREGAVGELGVDPESDGEPDWRHVIDGADRGE